MSEPLHPWTSGWRARLRSGLARHGCERLTQFARKHEAASWSRLIELLGGGLAPVQLQWVLEDEIKDQSDYDYFVRTTLIRQLHECERGWRATPECEVGLKLSGWATIIGKHTGAPHTWLKVARRLEARTDLPPEWLPSGIDDPVLVAAFEGVCFEWRPDLHRADIEERRHL
jgi:hypothetical protein